MTEYFLVLNNTSRPSYDTKGISQGGGCRQVLLGHHQKLIRKEEPRTSEIEKYRVKLPLTHLCYYSNIFFT